MCMRGSVSGVLRVGGCSLYGGRRRGGSTRVMIRGACTDCRAYRVTTRHTHTCHSHMRRCMSPPLAPPLINSQGLSAGRSGTDSWMRLSGMPRCSVCASCLGRGWGASGGSCSFCTYDFCTACVRAYSQCVLNCMYGIVQGRCYEIWIPLN